MRFSYDRPTDDISTIIYNSHLSQINMVSVNNNVCELEEVFSSKVK